MLGFPQLDTVASSLGSVVNDQVVAFLKNVPPFQFLPVAGLADLARSMSLEYFPKGTVILRAGRRTSESLYVVQKGGVQLAIRTEVGRLPLRQYGGPRETAGPGTLIAQTKVCVSSRFNWRPS